MGGCGLILIKGGMVLTEDGLVTCDVAIEDSVVMAVGPGLADPGGVVIDAAGSLVGPGFVDLHAHFREPGQTWKEDMESGSRAAAAGGFTAAVVMPNTTPAIDDPELALRLFSRSNEVGLIDAVPAGALTAARSGEQLANLEALYNAGVRVFTDDGDCLESESLLRSAMEVLSTLPGAVLAQHAEDTSRANAGHMHQGALSESLGMAGIPTEVETSIVARDLALVEEMGVTYHCQHVSAAGTVDLIRKAKAKGLPVTAEVTPHHLTFADDSVGDLDPSFKMYPPLRGVADREALRVGLRDRTIDAVATDHAPHTAGEKDVPFADAPRGVIGLETAVSAVFEILEDPILVFEVLSRSPAGIAGFSRQGRPVEVGAPANLVIFDPSRTWVAEEFYSKSSNSPYRGREMRGCVIATIYEGRLTHALEAAQ